MKRLIRTLLIFTLSAICLCTSANFALAAENAFEKISDNNGGILSISYRGDTAAFPKNSLEAIRAAEKAGADMVSVSLAKTRDGVIILCEDEDFPTICNTSEMNVGSLTYNEIQKLYMLESNGSVSKCKIVSLETALKRHGQSAVLVLDNGWEMKDEIEALAKKCGAEKKVILRTYESSKEIIRYKQNGGMLSVLGVYKGNIVFNVISHLNRLSKTESMVQYQSKNYFNVAFDNFSSKRYSSEHNARAVVPMYSKDLCGQREDNVSGWDEMIKRGFSVIETNDIGGLCAYTKNTEAESEKLRSLYEKAEKVNTVLYTQTSAKNLNTALENAKTCLETRNTSLGEIQSAYSFLAESLNNMKISMQFDSMKGSLNITAGKIAAVIIFGALLLAGEFYLIKMRKKGEN